MLIARFDLGDFRRVGLLASIRRLAVTLVCTREISAANLKRSTVTLCVVESGLYYVRRHRSDERRWCCVASALERMPRGNWVKR